MILVVILACVGPFFVKGPDGQPLMTLEDWMPANLAAAPTAVINAPPEKVTVYKWQDENGVWQFSNNPADAGSAESMELDGNINIIPAVQVETVSATPKPAAPSAAAIPAGMTSVSPEKIQQMMDTVNNLQQTVDQRKTDMDRAIRQQ